MIRMDVTMKPSRDQVREWIENFVPKIDIFFIEEKMLPVLAEHLKEVLVIPRKEFFEHTTYNQIQLVNSYMYWNISKSVEYVLVAQPDWIDKLPVQSKRDILYTQFKVGRGLIFPMSLFSDPPAIPEEYIFEEDGQKFIVVQHGMWNVLSYESKEGAIQEYAKLWDNWSCCEVPEHTPVHIEKYANSFSSVAGSNCLSATLFAITGQEWIIGEWVYPETFLKGLEREKFYRTTTDRIQKEDVMAWVDDKGIVQHAAYHLGNNFFFNKNGQTCFNPWKIINSEQLNEEWNQYEKIVYRKEL